ncbi:MAG: hypothetical protein J5879_07535, partial [Clostridia bacterium]|nr:hypothetical protein [Clostridia bacterium]
MEYKFEDVAEKLAAAGMDEKRINTSIAALQDAYSSVPSDELQTALEEVGGADGIAAAIIDSYNTYTDAAADAPQDEAPAPEDGPSDVPADGPEEEPEPEEDKNDREKLNIISLDDDMFSDESEEEISEDTAGEKHKRDEEVEEVISKIESGGESAHSVSVDDYFGDDDDVKVKRSSGKKPVKKQPAASPAGQKQQKNGKKPGKSNVSVKNMSSKGKATYIIGLILLIPLLIIVVVTITLLLLALYLAVIALVVAFSVALVVIASVGTALSLMAIIYGVIQIVQGVAAPIGIYEIGL